MGNEMTRRGFMGVAGAGMAVAGLAGAMSVSAVAQAEETTGGPVDLVRGSTTADGKIDPSLVMPSELGREWHEFKDGCYALYPGYTHYDEYLNFIKDKLTEYGCVDILEHHFDSLC